MSTARIIFPRAFAFSVDDLGWNEGSSLFGFGLGPARAGVKRTFELSDYRHLIDVAKAVNVRIQCVFILSEMDRENVLAKVPSATHMRGAWDNSKHVNDHQLEIMQYVRDQSAYMEFGLHGTGHEYWPADGVQRRAEWYNLQDKHPWPEQSLRDHIQGFREIMRQYGLSKESGHSFPESFVPCAYSYYWNPTGSYSLGKLLTEAGVKYANTDFSQIPELNPPAGPNGGGFDYGTLVINRKNFGNPWYALASLPIVPIEEQDTDVIEAHWPNWLAADDFLQPEVTAQWIAYYKHVQQTSDRYIAKNTEQLYSQWLYKKYSRISEEVPGKVLIDNTAMPDNAYVHQTLGNLVLKLHLSADEHVASASINGEPIPAYLEDEGFAFLYLPPLEQKNYILSYCLGDKAMPLHVFHNGTYNVYSVRRQAQDVLIDLKVYGEQVVVIRTAEPEKILSENEKLRILRTEYAGDSGILRVTLVASDMQGDRGVIRLLYRENHIA